MLHWHQQRRQVGHDLFAILFQFGRIIAAASHCFHLFLDYEKGRVAIHTAFFAVVPDHFFHHRVRTLIDELVQVAGHDFQLIVRQGHSHFDQIFEQAILDDKRIPLLLRKSPTYFLLDPLHHLFPMDYRRIFRCFYLVHRLDLGSLFFINGPQLLLADKF